MQSNEDFRLNSAVKPKPIAQMELIDFMRILAPHKWRIVLLTLTVTSLFTAAAFYKTPVYRVTTVLAPAGDDKGMGSLSSALGQLGGLASMAGINVGNGNSNIEEALAVLRSREFTEKFIVENGLIQQLFPKKWDAENGRWRVPPEQVPTPAKASKYFGKSIRSVIQDKKTGLISLNIDWRNAIRATEWSKLLVARLNEEMRQRALRNADQYIEYLQKELLSTSVVETRDAINRLLEAQIKQRMIASVTTEYAFRVVDRGMPPESDDFIRPQRVLWALSGFVCGLIGSVLLALMQVFIRSSAKEKSGVVISE